MGAVRRLLHVHHEHEDDDFFPIIAAASPDLQPLIEQLEREHEELVALLDAVDGAVAARRGTRTPRRAALCTTRSPWCATSSSRTSTSRTRSCSPRPPATVDPKEWDEASDRALRAGSRVADLPVAGGTLDEVARSLPPDRRPPPPPCFLRFMLTLSWRRRYAKFIEPTHSPLPTWRVR